MPTRLAAWSDRFIEASWLMVALVTPLFFNVFSSRVFEPDKATAFRAIMLFALGFWVLRELEQPGGPRVLPARWINGLKRNPFSLPVLILAGSYVISTIFSVQPDVSFW
ncbi:MAG: hypothetical protein NZ518_03150, partial [Dehalococcoidia bacterium]|nr:hypothetical protein [Dehalococcoidia bacterium]